MFTNPGVMSEDFHGCRVREPLKKINQQLLPWRSASGTTHGDVLQGVRGPLDLSKGEGQEHAHAYRVELG